MDYRTDNSVGHARWKVLLVVLGAALLAGSALVGFTGFTDTHKHDVREINVNDAGVTGDRAVLTTEDLSVAEQSVLLDAITAESPAWTNDPVGLLFRYPDGPHTSEYLVEVDGALYLLETSEEMRPIAIVATGLRLSFGIAGGLLLLAGAVPLLRSALAPQAVPTPELNILFGTWLPSWASLALAPPATLVIAYPVMFETFVEVPLNLFVTPFVLATGICVAVTVLILPRVDVSDTFVLGSALNIPVLWTVAVAFVVAPSPGEAQAMLTLLVGVASLSVLVGVTVGWYILRWRELRQSEYPTPRYWRI